MPDIDVVLLYPELLGLYADRGNALALEHRARLHGLEVDTLEVHPGDDIPDSADIYLLGGAEDAAMTVSLTLLQEQQGLSRAIDRGAQVLGVCAGFQILGHSFLGPDGRPQAGLGHLDAESGHLAEARAVGDILVESPYVGELQGFENHRGETRLGPAAKPLGTVDVGIGNGPAGTEGAIQDNIVGTYLHGPVLARNPALADLLLSRVVGRPLEPVVDPIVEELRAERRQSVRRAANGGFWQRLRNR